MYCESWTRGPLERFTFGYDRLCRPASAFVIRYQYTVEYRTKGEIIHFGIDHFVEHTQIPGSVVKAVLKGFKGVDYELDELLTKVQQGWSLSVVIPPDIEIPNEFKKPLDLGLPLLDRQEMRLRQLIRAAQDAQWMNRDVNHLVRKQTSVHTQPTFSGGTETKELWEDVNPVKSSSVDAWVDPPTRLTPQQQTYILELLNAGTESARLICELMIRNGVSKNQRFLTKKPLIYPYVCQFLDNLVREGSVRCVEVRGTTDRWYRRE